MPAELQQWWATFSQPEYLHVLLNPLPAHGALLGSVVLVVALLLRSRPAQVAALGVILISCASVWLVMEYGEHGYDRVSSMSYTAGRAWLEVHEERAEDLVWVFYLTAAVAFAAMVLPAEVHGRKVRTFLTVSTLVLAILSMAAGAWIGHAGGQIRHKEFRNGPPPVSAEHEHEAHE